MKIIPLVIGSLGAIPKQCSNKLKQIGITVGTTKKTVLLGTDSSTGFGLISTVFFSIVLRCVNNNNNNNNNNNGNYNKNRTEI